MTDENYIELGQLWGNEPGSFLRVVQSQKNGAITLQWRTGPQGSVAASSVRASLELTNYRAARLRDILTASGELFETQEGVGE